MGVGLGEIAVEPGVGYYFDVVAEVVEDQDGVAEHKDGFGDGLGVGGGGRDAGLEVADGVVGQIADGAAVEAGEAVDRGQLVAGHFGLDQGQGVDFAGGLAGAGGDYFVGVGADEAVAAHPLAALDAFQQVGVGAAGDFQVGGNRGFEVGVDGAADGGEVALPGHGLYLVEGGVVHRLAWPPYGGAGDFGFGWMAAGCGGYKKTRPLRDESASRCHPFSPARA